MSEDFVTRDVAPSTTQAEKIAEARARAMAAASHFGSSSSSSGENVRCDRCRLPLNRWNEPCDGPLTAERLLALDVLYLADLIEARR